MRALGRRRPGPHPGPAFRGRFRRGPRLGLRGGLRPGLGSGRRDGRRRPGGGPIRVPCGGGRRAGGGRTERGRRVVDRFRDDRGVSILEFTGFLPILLLIGMATIQLGLIGYGANQAGSGARAAARVASQGGDGAAAGQAAVSGWLAPQVAPARGADLTTATVTVHVPGLIPLFGGYDLTRTATMPTDD